VIICVGKTRIAILTLKRYFLKYPNRRALIIVPSIPLHKQWTSLLEKNSLTNGCTVRVINTALKYSWDQEFLIIDEVHRMAATEFRKIFSLVNYKQILCLTATIKRLDGLDFIIEHYAPVCDEVPLNVCLANNWVSPYREYKVLIKTDLTEYRAIHTEFVKHFSFFNYDFDLAMRCVKSISQQNLLAKQLGVHIKQVKASTYSFVRLMKLRKQWVLEHPEKIKITEQILNARKDKKILTFSSSIDMVKKLQGGFVVHSKISPKKVQKIISDFIACDSGALHSVDSLRDGIDITGVSVGVLLGYNRSTLKKIQTIGRVIRKEGQNKSAEVFTLVIQDTIEEDWFRKSSKDKTYTTIDANDLDIVLNNSYVEQKDVIYFS
jgi:superfamily II DNA or RNA helicase